MRAISTVLDTMIFLLLLGGAIATLVAGTGAVHSPATGDDPAEETVQQLATTTTTVEYTLTPTANDSDRVEYGSDASGFDRTAHGTTAGLLASATLGSATMGGERLAPASGGFERVVRNRTRDIVQRRDSAVAVTARWTPYEGAPIDGRIHVGSKPSRTADVRAARLTVDSGVPSARDRALAAADDGWDAVARAAATAVVEGMFPPERTRIALRGDAPVDTLTAHRYRRVARLSNATLLDFSNASVANLNDRLVTALTDRFAADMRRRFETPRAAASTVRTGEVRIVVRTWSP